jgi:hypothetical protein
MPKRENVTGFYREGAGERGGVSPPLPSPRGKKGNALLGGEGGEIVLFSKKSLKGIAFLTVMWYNNATHKIHFQNGV